MALPITLSTAAAAPVVDLIRVVLADDSSATRLLVGYELSSSSGFDLLGAAADGAAAIALIEADRPDCAVFDVDMPGLGGFEALAEVRRRWPEVPVVMLSGFFSDAHFQRAAVAGAAAYLDKNTQLPALRETIRRVVAAAATVVPASAATPGAQSGSSVALLRQPLDPAPAHTSAVRGSRTGTESATAELHRFEYVVSHDLAEPLRSMRGFATLLQTRYATTLDESGQAFVGEISAAADRMQAMIDDLLTYSRAGRVSPRFDAVPLASPTEAALQSLRATIEARGAEISVGTLPTGWADAALLATVLREVLLNAITFNTAPVPTVTVEGLLDGDTAVISIHDNGIGIPPAHLDRALDLFVRLNTRDEFTGTGTGLALCRRLLSLQRGDISLQSTPGDGTTVTITVPAYAPQGETS